MTRRKTPPAPPEPKAEPAREDLLTAEDLFGDLVDGLVAPRPDAPKPPEKKAGPLRVRIGDPGRAPGGGEAPSGDLPPDVEALLARLGPMGGITPAEGVIPEAKAEAPPEPEPEPGAPEAAPESGMFDLLEPDEPAVSPALKDLPMDDDFLPAVAPRTATKFQVAPALPVDDGLDLAVVAQEAISPDAVPKDRSEKKSWRDDVYGPYQLLDRIAVGGMAEVFKAKRAGLAGFEKTLAVKRILPHLSDNEEFVRMFVDEAKMVAGMAHPNIVQIFDLGKIDKTYFIAMEYVHGRDLRTILRRAKEKELRLPLDLALRIASALGAALEFAHRKKDERGRAMEIVHRDVSPQNILISFEGDVKLTDFGIAKAATKASSTDRGALRGKLLYMSPEQAWGKPIDRRSDIFSLGIVLYEMITDEKPFLAQSDGSEVEMTILEKVRRCEIPAARSRNPKIPESLDRVVMKALARDPDERYQDAAEMNRALERVIRERQPLSTGELKRFMELLFDREEREEAVPDELFSRAPGSPERAIAESGLDERQGLVHEKTPAPDTRPDAELSVDALLRRFGIK
jgi:serine/threonine protein kinase